MQAYSQINKVDYVLQYKSLLTNYQLINYTAGQPQQNNYSSRIDYTFSVQYVTNLTDAARAQLAADTYHAFEAQYFPGFYYSTGVPSGVQMVCN